MSNFVSPPMKEAGDSGAATDRKARHYYRATHMGHYDNGEHGSNAPGDVEMARAPPAGSLAMIVAVTRKIRSAWRQKQKQVDYVPGTPCKPDQQNGIWIVQAHEGQIRGTG